MTTILQISFARVRPLRAITMLACLFAFSFFASGFEATKTYAADEPIGLNVPNGFEITQFADDDLAHDIFCMTIDSLGRPVVSGPGYVRILIDKDDDGIADEYETFCDGPKRGAQGMFFNGRDLIAAGDDGLVIYRDDDGDYKADGEPEVFLRMNTGSEHNAHAIRRGPDGWWYFIVGNTTGLTNAYASIPTSPIKKPRGGALLRLQPNFSGSEVLVDGFRNAYDFAFHPQGEIFTWDSDGERDVSLPWYRPTRVFHAVPQGDAGWVSRSWKRPSYYFDMLPVVGAFGRGSPTGVECYQHVQFPREYYGAVFVQDWTFGRIWALPMRQKDGEWRAEPIEFVTTKGSYGFAPTDMAVAPDGSLLICVGGRGTRGSVYRIEYTGDDKPKVSTPDFDSVDSVVMAPQPLAAWSRAEWVPTAEKLGRDEFAKAALDSERTARERVRAIEVLTELFSGVDEATAEKLIKTKSTPVRARTAWALGRKKPSDPPLRLLKPLLSDEQGLVRRSALEALVCATEDLDEPLIRKELLTALKSKNSVERLAATRIIRKLTKPQLGALVKEIDRRSAEAVLTLLFARTERPEKVDISVLETCLVALEVDAYSTDVKMLAIRLFQLSLGDIGPAGLPASFDGYGAVQDLVPYEEELVKYADRLAKVFPTNAEPLDAEIARSIAMINAKDDKVVSRFLKKITEKSSPIQDLHYLLCAALVEADRSSAATKATVRALLQLEDKYETRKLNRDSNWDVRLGELYRQLCRVDKNLADAIINDSDFGSPAHVAFLSTVPKDNRQPALNKIVATIEESEDFRWTPEVVFAIGRSNRPADINLLRDQLDNYAVRDAVLRVLAKQPSETDRDAYVSGLSASSINVLNDCVAALTKLSKAKDGGELFALLKLARRLTDGTQEFRLREKVVRLLQENTSRKFDFEFDFDGYKPQPKVLASWNDYLTDAYPDAAKKSGQSAGELKSVRALMAEANWDKGDATRGAALFEKRACARCHGQRSALGPSLEGVTSRFSRDDLFTAIAAPDRDVSPRYQTEIVETSGGRVYSGLVIYHSVDGLLIRDDQNQTYRFPGSEIASRHKTQKSLMPSGLLKDLGAQDLADLYSYLATLK